MRKAYYSLKLGLKQSEEAPALAFGSSIHKALEHWYQLPNNERVLPEHLAEQASLFAYGHNLDVPCDNGALESIRQFANCRYSVLSVLPESDKRSLSNGIRILKAYFKHYANDGYHVMRDAQGPIVERQVEFVLIDEPHIKVTYFGTIDVVLQHEQTGVVVVADHKTTSALGSEFYNRCRPNMQYTGYVMAAREALCIDTSLFMINGLQVAKTKTEFARQITDRNESDFYELKCSVWEASQRWIEANEFVMIPDYRLSFPMGTVNACSNFGGCPYRPICEVPESLKPNVIRMQYGNR